MEKKRIVVLLYGVLMLSFLLYAGLRVMEYSAVKKVDVSGYLTNDNINFKIEQMVDSSNPAVIGYAYWYGDMEHNFDYRLALLDTVSGDVYELPTQLYEREDKEELYSPVSHFGFLARLNRRKLDLDHRVYQYCYISRLNRKEGVIAHTDSYIGGDSDG